LGAAFFLFAVDLVDFDAWKLDFAFVLLFLEGKERDSGSLATVGRFSKI